MIARAGPNFSTKGALVNLPGDQGGLGPQGSSPSARKVERPCNVEKGGIDSLREGGLVDEQ